MSTAAVALRMKVIGDQAAAAALQNLERKSQQTGRASQAAMDKAAQSAARAADQMQSKFGGAARQMASALETMARTGRATGDALKQVVTQAAEMAFVFGPHGAIVGAIAIAGKAVYDFFARTRNEIAETTRSAMQELAQMARSLNVRALGDKTREIMFGDPGADIEGRRDGESERDFLKRRLGVFGLERERDLLQAKARVKLASGAQADVELRQVREYQKALEELNATLTTYQRVLVQVQAVTQSMVKTRDGSATPAPSTSDGRATGGIPLPPLAPVVANSSQRGAASAGPIQAGSIPYTTPGQIAESLRNSPVVQEANSAMVEIADAIQTGFAATLGSAVSNAFATAFSGQGIESSLKAFGQTVLAGIGGIFQQMGAVYLKYGLIMNGLAKLLPNPFTAGAAGIAIGVALMALGGALQGIATGGGAGRGGIPGGTGRYDSGATVIDRGLINPLNPLTGQTSERVTPAPPVTNNFTVIGEHDLRAQRMIADMVRRATSRGSLSSPTNSGRINPLKPR